MENQNLKLLKQADAFNETYKVGQKVKVLRDDDSIEEHVLTHEASILGGHSLVVWLDGISGCYDADRVVGLA